MDARTGQVVEDLGRAERKAVYSLLVWSGLFTAGETVLTGSLVYGLLSQHHPENVLQLLGIAQPLRVGPVLGLVAALVVTFGGSLWASRRYLSRAVSPVLSAAAGRRRLSRAEFDAQVDQFKAFNANLVVFSVLGYAAWLSVFVGVNSEMGMKMGWLPGAAYGGTCAALLFWLRIKLLGPEPLPTLRRWPVYQLLAALASIGAAVWLNEADQKNPALFALLAGAFMVLVWWMYSNDQGLSRRARVAAVADATPDEKPAADGASRPEVPETDRVLPGHAIWRQHFTSAGGVFIIHGHGREHRLDLERRLESWGVRTITLQDEAAAGTYTIFELFEDYAEQCDFGIALLTPDDTVTVQTGGDDDEPIQQARPNVIFEIGWFLGRKGRQRLCLIKQKDTELPSNLRGARSLEFDESLDEISRGLRGTLQIWGLVEPGDPSA